MLSGSTLTLNFEMDTSCTSGWPLGPSFLYVILLAVVLATALVTLIVVYLLDVNYFIRTLAVFLVAKFLKKPLKLLETSEISSRVLSFDADIFLTHMNNARVLREYDFGRMDLLTRNGWLSYITEKFTTLKGGPVVVGHVIRYRRALHMFSKYKITTRIVYWDGKVLYLEDKIITCSDNITRCIGYTMVHNPFKVDDFVKECHPDAVKPDLPPDISLWMKYNEANSSRKVKRKDTLPTEDVEEDFDEDMSDQWLSTDYNSR